MITRFWVVCSTVVSFLRFQFVSFDRWTKHRRVNCCSETLSNSTEFYTMADPNYPNFGGARAIYPSRLVPPMIDQFFHQNSQTFWLNWSNVVLTGTCPTSFCSWERSSSGVLGYLSPMICWSLFTSCSSCSLSKQGEWQEGWGICNERKNVKKPVKNRSDTKAVLPICIFCTLSCGLCNSGHILFLVIFGWNVCRSALFLIFLQKPFSSGKKISKHQVKTAKESDFAHAHVLPPVFHWPWNCSSVDVPVLSPCPSPLGWGIVSAIGSSHSEFPEPSDPPKSENYQSVLAKLYEMSDSPPTRWKIVCQPGTENIFLSRGSELILVCPCICLRMSCPA